MITKRSFSEYDDAVLDLDHGSPIPNADLAYYTLAFAGEAGEVANEIKKMYRDEKGLITPERRINTIKELGDCMWYMSRIAALLHASLDEVQSVNIEKLRDAREKKNVGALAGR